MRNGGLEFCINGGQDGPIEKTIELRKACDDGVVDVFGIPDSAVRSPELYASLTLCALNTSRMRIMPCVSNPITRHPSVTASGMATLSAIAPGRAALGLATGDSSIWGVGLKPARVERLRSYIQAVKGLLAGEEVTWEGKTFRQQWDAWAPDRHIPIYVACSGPKVLKMAAQTADGVIVTMGFSDEDVRYIRGIIAEGCAEVGRDPAEVDIWWNGYIVFGESVEEAMSRSLGWPMGWLTMTTMEGKGIPEQYRDAVAELNADKHSIEAVYKVPDRHKVLAERAKKLGIYDWLVSRSPKLYGTPDDIVARLHELAADGMNHWMFYITGPADTRSTLVRRLTTEVIPKLG